MGHHIDMITGEITVRETIGCIDDHLIDIIHNTDLIVIVEVIGVTTAHSMVNVRKVGTNILVIYTIMEVPATIHPIICIITMGIGIDNTI